MRSAPVNIAKWPDPRSWSRLAMQSGAGSPTNGVTTMPENQIIRRNDRISVESAAAADWASLVARAVDDITRIVHSEFRLLVAGMQTVLDEGIDRVLGFVATGVLIMAGALCMLAAIIMFLHEFVMLPWW